MKNSKQYAYHTASYFDYKEKMEFAKRMRRNPTDAEAVMWDVLRHSFPNRRFRRQHIIGDYVVDFICLKENLVIEIDGEYHHSPQQVALDNQRTQFLEEHGFRVLRFTNNEVLFDIDKVTDILTLNLT